MRKKIVLALTFILILLNTGCWDSKDINKKCINISLGVDYVDELIEFSSEIVKLTNSNNEQSNDLEDSSVYTVFSYGVDFEEARKTNNSRVPYNMFLGATRVVIFGEDFARLGIEPYLNRIDGLFDYRKTLNTIVCRGLASELLSVKTDKSIPIGFLIDRMIHHQIDEGTIISPNIGNILSIIAFGSEGYLMPYIGLESGEITYLGLAVFKDSKFINVIPTKKTAPVLYILARNPKLFEVITLPNENKNKYSLRVHINDRKIKTSYVNDSVLIDIKLDIHAEVLYQYYESQITREKFNHLENELTQKISTEIYSIIKQAQSDYKCDIFNFGEIFRAQNFYKYQEIDWAEEFLSATIKVDINTTIVDNNFKNYDSQ